MSEREPINQAEAEELDGVHSARRRLIQNLILSLADSALFLNRCEFGPGDRQTFLDCVRGAEVTARQLREEVERQHEWSRRQHDKASL